jgi:hypothetical protein
MTAWQENLEVIGTELFQRYRKRLLAPGITREICNDYPGLSILDALIRVHAGRRIIAQGDDFHALQAIHSGQWQRARRQHERGRPAVRERRDRLSRSLVRLGGVLFAVFALLFVLAILAAGPGAWLVLIPGSGLAVVAALCHRRRIPCTGVAREARRLPAVMQRHRSESRG